MRPSWFSTATMYPVDSGLAATNAEAYVGYMFAKELFGTLLDKDPAAALVVLNDFSCEQPTVLHAMLCGVVIQVGRTPSKATELHRRLHEAQPLGIWKSLIKSENPIVRSLALEMVPSDIASSPILTDAIGDTLTNKWVSLQMIAIETAGKHRPPNVGATLDDYLSKLPSLDIPSAIKESLRAKAIESKSVLKKSDSNAQ
ncbi:MAG: hypothetical protein E4H40_00580 [Candidatus Brocadiia bacterium]|nr:MAG: hypothetical protein E4H40_00580 [Candidatus Brocadiia bacterium]